MRKIPRAHSGKLRRIFCVLFGHAKVYESCFGYISCARCGEQIGDTLGGTFPTRTAVILGHDCPTCFENYKKMRWLDRVLCPYPFTEDHPLTPDEFEARMKEAMDEFKKLVEARKAEAEAAR